MAIYGYHRTSTAEQNLDRGINAIAEYCKSNGIHLDELFTDQQTGKNFNRPDYTTLKRIAKAGDCIILSELDRLGRDKAGTLAELQHYKAQGIRIMILEIPTTLVDYATLAGQKNDLSAMLMETINNMLIEMYATLAHAEMQKREKRQREGIAAKKAKGEWENYGRPQAIDFNAFVAEYNKVLSGEMKPFDCARSLGMKISTFYSYKRKYDALYKGGAANGSAKGQI